MELRISATGISKTCVCVRVRVCCRYMCVDGCMYGLEPKAHFKFNGIVGCFVYFFMAFLLPPAQIFNSKLPNSEWLLRGSGGCTHQIKIFRLLFLVVDSFGGYTHFYFRYFSYSLQSLRMTTVLRWSSQNIPYTWGKGQADFVLLLFSNNRHTFNGMATNRPTKRACFNAYRHEFSYLSQATRPKNEYTVHQTLVFYDFIPIRMAKNHLPLLEAHQSNLSLTLTL